MKIPIIGTGLTGLVGSRIVELLSDRYEFEDLSIGKKTDITDRDDLYSKVKASQADWVLHLAAKADVDMCEADRRMGKEGEAWRVNVIGTQNICEAAHETGKRLIYISTDFVFKGDKSVYHEYDTTDPINWYGMTKAEGEKIVSRYPGNLVLRISYPFKKEVSQKKDLLHHMLYKLKSGKPVYAVTDHIFTPTFIDDIAQAIARLIQLGENGIFHAVGSSSVTPYQAVELIAKVFEYPGSKILPITRRKFYKDRAPRPYQLVLKNDKITALGVIMHSFTDSLHIIKRKGLVP